MQRMGHFAFAANANVILRGVETSLRDVSVSLKDRWGRQERRC